MGKSSTKNDILFLSQSFDQKRLKRMSNVFSTSLIIEQFVAVVASYSALLMGLLIQSVATGSGSAFQFMNIIEMFSNYNNYPLFGFLMLLVYFAYMFVPFAIIALVIKQNPFKEIQFKFKKANVLPPLIIIGLFASVVGDFYSQIFTSILSQFHLEVNLGAFDIPNNGLSLIIYFLSVSVFAPICEELIFRGLILQNLRKFGDFFALIVSSLMFGILHGNFAQTPFAFVVGLALGFAVIETGSIFSGMIIHCLINTVSTVFSVVAAFSGDYAANISYLIYIVVLVIAVFFALTLLKKKNFFKDISQRYFDKNLLTGNVFVKFIKTPGFICFFILYFISMFLVLKRI